MRHFALPLVLLFAATPAMAQDAPLPPGSDAVPDGGTAPTDDGPDGGQSLIEQGAQLMLRGFLSEVAPELDSMSKALREMEPTLRAMGPMLQDLAPLIGNAEAYDPPIRLPNGDILIRRKAGHPPAVPPDPDGRPGCAPGPDCPPPGTEIEL